MAAPQVQAVQFVAKTLGINDCSPSTSGETGQVQVNTKDGQLTGLATVCQYYASHSSQASQLLGSTPAEQAQVGGKGMHVASLIGQFGVLNVTEFIYFMP